MPDKEGTRRKYLTLQAIDLHDGTKGQIQISFDRMQTVGRRSMGHAQECGYIVPMILQNPTAVFEGLRTRRYSPQSVSRPGLRRVRKRGRRGVQLAMGEGRSERPQLATEL